MDYYPDTYEDPTFNGYADGWEEVCCVHGKFPQKCVAFEGSNTGRRFYMCSIESVSKFDQFVWYSSLLFFVQ
jgi:hypothetical protein